MTHDHITPETISAVATKTTYAGAGTSAIGWITSSEGVAAIGLLLALLGFIVNLYFKIKQDKREAVEHEVRMAKLEAMSQFPSHE